MSFRFSKCLTGPGQDHVCFVLRVNNLHWDRQPTRIFLPYVNIMVPFAACLIYHVINKVTARQWRWEPSIGIIGPKIHLRIGYNCLTIKICARIITLIKPHQKLQVSIRTTESKVFAYCLVYNWKSTIGEWEDIWISPRPINLICRDTNVDENKQASFLFSSSNLFFLFLVLLSSLFTGYNSSEYTEGKKWLFAFWTMCKLIRHALLLIVQILKKKTILFLIIFNSLELSWT